MHSQFQILLRGVLGVVRKSGWGSSIFVFYCIFMIQFFEVFEGVQERPVERKYVDIGNMFSKAIFPKKMKIKI